MSFLLAAIIQLSVDFVARTANGTFYDVMDKKGAHPSHETVLYAMVLHATVLRAMVLHATVLHAIAAYRSQMEALFGGTAAMEAAIAAYHAMLAQERDGYAERIWRIA